MLDEADTPNMKWANDHFIKLKIMILRKIGNKYADKVIHNWYISQLSQLILEMIRCRSKYGQQFTVTRWLGDYPIPKEHFQTAFEDATDQEFVNPGEQESEYYQWLKGIVERYLQN